MPTALSYSEKRKISPTALKQRHTFVNIVMRRMGFRKVEYFPDSSAVLRESLYYTQTLIMNGISVL